MATITRRDWIRWFGAIVPAGAFLAACQKSGMLDVKDAPVAIPGAKVAIGDNHSHALHDLVIPLADVMAGVDKTYEFRGCSNHCHHVTFTAADFAKLQAGQTVANETADDLDLDGSTDANPFLHLVSVRVDTCPDPTPLACTPDQSGCEDKEICGPGVTS